jgi:hypothetical protein
LPRKSKIDEIVDGIFSVKNAADLIGTSPQTITFNCEQGNIDHHRISSGQRRELRIPAISLYKFCKKNNIPIHRNLVQALKNYLMKYAQPTMTLDEIVKNFDKIDSKISPNNNPLNNKTSTENKEKVNV